MADPVENLAAAAEQVERGADEQAGFKRKRSTALEVAVKKLKDVHERVALSQAKICSKDGKEGKRKRDEEQVEKSMRGSRSCGRR